MSKRGKGESVKERQRRKREGREDARRVEVTHRRRESDALLQGGARRGSRGRGEREEGKGVERMLSRTGRENGR